MQDQLVIRDGEPYWYLSPDIWVVPGDDPDGSPRNPVAGQRAYIWARVTNKSNVDLFDIRVDFYWANPALEITRSNITLVGFAYVDVPRNSTQEVVCLSQWLPVVVNDGHECLIAAASHPQFPVNEGLTRLDPLGCSQIAQKNLTVLTNNMDSLTITVSGYERTDKQVVLKTQLGGSLDAETLAMLGLDGFDNTEGPALEVGLSLDRHHEPVENEAIELYVPKGTSRAVYLTVRVKHLDPQRYQLLRIEEQANGSVLGGLGLVVISQN